MNLSDVVAWTASKDELIKKCILESTQVIQRLGEDPTIALAGHLIVRAIRTGHKILLCGNGGSAADAQHIAAELVGHYSIDREPLPAIALTVDTSALTAIGNDYGFDHVFARQLAALGQKGDCLIAISTSGNSHNVLYAMIQAQEIGIDVVGLTGQTGGDAHPIAPGGSSNGIRFEQLCDVCVKVLSMYTPLIQQAHITIGHLFCEMIDSEYGPRD